MKLTGKLLKMRLPIYINQNDRAKRKQRRFFNNILTENGKRKALTYQIDEMKIKKAQKWDKKWRIVLFDIPEKKKKIREALRHHLKNLDFLNIKKACSFILMIAKTK